MFDESDLLEPSQVWSRTLRNMSAMMPRRHSSKSHNCSRGVLEQSSKSGMIGLTYEALKTKHQMRKVHQIKERREVLEKLPGVQQRKRKDDNDELRNFAARFNSLQLEQDTRSLETAQLEFQDAVDAKDAEAAKRGKPEVRKLNSMTCNSVIQAQIGA